MNRAIIKSWPLSARATRLGRVEKSPFDTFPQKTKLHRHAVAFALVGWYLMLPPTFENKYGALEPDYSTPVSQWEQQAAYDSAIACNEGKSDYNKELAVFKAKVAGALSGPKAGTAIIVAALYAQCIASDDPRLKPEQSSR